MLANFKIPNLINIKSVVQFLHLNKSNLSDIKTCKEESKPRASTFPIICFSESVYNLCDKGLEEMNLTSAILLSHEDYPWNYETNPLTCQKRLRVHRKYGLRILSNHLDLPPRSKNGDLLRLWDVSENNRRTLRKDFAGNDVLEETFVSGCVDIEFRKGRHSMHGQGFALKLEREF